MRLSSPSITLPRGGLHRLRHSKLAQENHIGPDRSSRSRDDRLSRLECGRHFHSVSAVELGVVNLPISVSLDGNTIRLGNLGQIGRTPFQRVCQ